MAVRPPIGLIFWLLYLATALLQVSLGLLLGVGVIKTFVKNPQANAKLDQTLTKLSPFQGTLGIAAIVVGLVFIVVEIIHVSDAFAALTRLPGEGTGGWSLSSGHLIAQTHDSFRPTRH